MLLDCLGFRFGSHPTCCNKRANALNMTKRHWFADRMTRWKFYNLTTSPIRFIHLTI